MPRKNAQASLKTVEEEIRSHLDSVVGKVKPFTELVSWVARQRPDLAPQTIEDAVRKLIEKGVLHTPIYVGLTH